MPSGIFRFSRVSGADVYFDEWSESSQSTAADRVVYYVGDERHTTAPTPGFATYSVRGISDYANKGLLSGAFRARFISTGGVLRGTLSNGASGAGKYTLDIGTARINGVNFSGNGAMAAYNDSQRKVVTGGTAKGRFFGANAQALAGIATFKGKGNTTPRLAAPCKPGKW